MSAILVLFHCESNPGFAASSHEHTFLEVAKHIADDYKDIHYAYSCLDGGMSPSLPAELSNVILLDTRWKEASQLRKVAAYISKHKIKYLLGFDQPVKRPVYKTLRKAGIERFVSYWGAPMSSINKGIKLYLKRAEVALSRYGPDHYIFQSEGMLDTAIYGRGIPKEMTSVVRTGIDTSKYHPSSGFSNYAHEQFNIPTDRKIVVFSGHMESRKGVDVILKSAAYLIEVLELKNVHFLILGNKPNEARKFDSYLTNPAVKNCVTFGGYRTDIPSILQGCHIGMIASKGWDSFPMSSLEMAATELPLLVSNLQGLREAVTEVTGARFPPSDYVAAADKLNEWLSNDKLRRSLGSEGRKRVESYYSRRSQVLGLIAALENQR